jgi:hypothetical protein
MADRQRQNVPVTSSPHSIPTAQHLMRSSGMEVKREQASGKGEEEWQERLRALQDCICELLVKNQQLRTTLASVMANLSTEKDQ